jgi:hypothetical protein
MKRQDFQSAIASFTTRHRLPIETVSARAWNYLTRSRTCKELRIVIEEFIAAHKLSATTFGLWAMDDPRFLFDLRKGRSCFGVTVERVCLFMAAHETKQELKQTQKLNQQ